MHNTVPTIYKELTVQKKSQTSALVFAVQCHTPSLERDNSLYSSQVMSTGLAVGADFEGLLRFFRCNVEKRIFWAKENKMCVSGRVGWGLAECVRGTLVTVRGTCRDLAAIGGMPG